MAVYQCGGCSRLISGSIVPGGNPVAKANPQMWSATSSRCEACNGLRCDRCAPPGSSGCKLCGAGASKPPAGPGWGLLAILVQGAFPFVVMMSPYETPTRIAYWAGVALGVFAAWTMLASMGRGVFLRLLVGLTQFVPLVNLLVLLVLRGRATSARPASAAPPAPTPRVATLATIDDAARRLGLLLDQPVRGYSTYDFGRERDTNARSFLVDKKLPPAQVLRLRALVPPGFILFLGTSRWLGEEVHEGKAELVLARGGHSFTAVRVARVQPLNHGLDEDSVVEKLTEYDSKYGLELYEASSDSISFRVLRVPEVGDALAQDLLAFCPDLADHFASPAALMETIREADGWVTLWWD